MMSAKLSNHINSKNCYILLFIILFIFTRVYFIEYENNNIPHLDINFKNFFYQLYYHQSTNVGHFLLTYFYKAILGDSFTVKSAIIINSIYSFTSIYLLSKTINKISMLTFLIFLVYSTVLIPYETWRPFHWDHINIVIISLLVFSIHKFIDNYKNYYLFVLSSTFLVIFNSIGFLIFLFILITIFFLKNLKIRIKILFLIPFFLIFIIMLKNFFISKNFSPTSMGGANLIQRSIHAIGLENYYKMIYLNQDKYPKWWIKIHNNIKNKELKNINIHTSDHAHGYIENPKKRVEYFENIKSFLINDYPNNNELNKMISIEKKIIEKKFFSGIGYNINNIGNYYMSQGKKVFFQSCINFPVEMLIGKIGSKGFLLTGLQMISYSSLLPQYYENQNVQWNKWFETINKFVRFILFAILFFSIFVFIKIFRNKTYNKNIMLYLIIYLLIFLFVSITSILTCCENPRLMVMYSPMIIYVSYFNIVYIMNIMRK